MTNPINEREAFDAAFSAAFEFSEHIDQFEFRKGWEAGIIFARAASRVAPPQPDRTLIAEYAQYYHDAKSLKLIPFTFDEYASKCDAGEL